MKFKPSNFSKEELDHNTSSNPFQHTVPNQKTTYKETFDYNEQADTSLKATK